MTTLILDDHPDSAEAIALNFELSGQRAIAVTTSSDALRAIAQYRPSAAILDLAGEQLDGFAIANSFRHSPVAAVRGATLIAYSGLQDAIFHQKAVEAGFDYFLLKPSDPELLIALCLGTAHLPGPANFKLPAIDPVKFSTLTERSRRAITRAREIGNLIRALGK